LRDQRRRSRRFADERPTARAVSHVAVLALLAVTVMAGVTAAGTDNTSNGSQPGFPFGLVSVARGADTAALDPRSVYFELIPEPEAPDPLLSRRAPVFAPEPTPLPTPVAPPAPPPVPRPRYVKPAPIVGTGQLKWPVAGGTTITQYYSSYHLGLDIAAPSGTTVIASADGTVTWSGWKSNGGGLVVAIDHGNGIVTVYNHLGSAAVAAGAAVTAGQKIAEVGCTGTCTGPHVMFSVIVGGVIVNPLRYL
jgi:murein DD-endopeptidase MepM/ murein hydrolase activator NlpD